MKIMKTVEKRAEKWVWRHFLLMAGTYAVFVYHRVTNFVWVYTTLDFDFKGTFQGRKGQNLLNRKI